ncbi:flagellar hook-associated protein FlgL [Psychromonas algicola]|uniref:flagellar hook-associated protein FlgL n=1 Tax=Psychromonas algicola TaxID=2555642 RepID=UPI0010675106|nr:flagellar hook-associated protein FlgL [Psychromonas sp. RZ5]TEW46007.1 flagellar hook-associated protein 3 [Psychromonas sp. RZ5]
MRISSPTFHARNTTVLMDKQSDLSQKNIHLAASKRVIHGSDDPVAIATIQRLKQDLSVGEQFIKNGEMAESANRLSDVSLTQSTNILQRIRELLVSGSNGTLSEKDREIVSVELKALREGLIGAANTRDGNSQYIYSGFSVDTLPFQQNEFGEVEYHGDSGEREYRVGSSLTVKGNDAGSKVFMGIPEGNGIFVSELGSNNRGSAVITEGIVTDKVAARDFLKEDYVVAISKPNEIDKPTYSVYGLKEDTVAGNADVKIANIDLSDFSINNVNPSGVYPADGSNVKIEFVETGGNQFTVKVNGVSSSNAYDANNTNSQEINVGGITLEVDGLPANGDSYDFIKYIPPTAYEEEGQGISFNGIKTEIKGEVENKDTFTLRQSGEKDIFATIQSAIDALLIGDKENEASAKRVIAFNMSLLQVDAAMENITKIQTDTGSRLRTIDNQRESILDFNLTSKTTLSNLEDLDMAAAISDFQQQKGMLEVSQKAFVQLQQLSLFNLL